MQILPIRNFNQQNYNRNVTKPNFMGMQAKINPKTMTQYGILSRDTAYLAESIVHAYRDITSKLAQKTDLGLEILQQKYPNITIKSNFIFHNCGDDNSSISIKMGESPANFGLTYIGRREKAREYDKINIIEAFMMEGKERLVKNFSENYSTRFPQKREYFTQEEINSTQSNERLQKLLEDLDKAMLSFRKFLSVNMNDNLKLPPGEIPYQAKMKLNEAFRLCDEIDEAFEMVPATKKWLINKNYPNYFPVHGHKAFYFKDLGEEQVKINLAIVDSQNAENLKRLSVSDSEEKIKKAFLILNDRNFVANLTPNYLNCIPDKFTLADTKQMEEDFLPEYEKYLNLYVEALKDYQKYVNQCIEDWRKGVLEEKFKQIEPPGELKNDVQENLSKGMEYFQNANNLLKNIPLNLRSKIKAQVEGEQYPSSRKGLMLNGFEGNKIVHFLPLMTQKHPNLTRLTIIDNETGKSKMYLLQNLKHIVKNYNPDYPLVFPEILKYVSSEDIQEYDLEACSEFVKNRLEEFYNLTNEAATSKSMARERRAMASEQRQIKRSASKLTKNPEFKEFYKQCKVMFANAMNELDNGIGEFHNSLSAIRDKVTEFYYMHNK